MQDPKPELGTRRLLHQARAQLDPTVRWLRDRLAAHDAEHWLQELHQAPLPDQSRETLVLTDAMRRAAGLLAGDDHALEGADVDLLDQLWDVLAEGSPTPLAADYRRASRSLHDAAAPVASHASGSTRVGNYELSGLLGSGSFGTVYRARHVDNSMPAAVKLMRLGALGVDQIARFRNEARIAGQLDHPAIVRVLDSGVHEQCGVATPYVAWTLVDGKPFVKALADLPVPAILRTFAQLCEGIVHAHTAGVLHRDLKPANVLVDASGNPHVLDFGTACSAADEHRGDTASGLVLGTPGYMSPEQAAGHRVDERSDVWSLGALLFAALTKATPHRVDGLSTMQSLRLVAETEPRRVRSLRDDLDDDLAAVVDKAISHGAAERYASAAALARDVRRLLAGDPVDARPPTAWQSLRRLARKHRRATTGILATTTLGIVGAITTTILWRSAVLAEERLTKVSAEALTSARYGVEAAAQLAETTRAAEEQLRLLQPVLTAVTTLRAMSHFEPTGWLQLESSLREVDGDLAQRARHLELARQERVRVLDAQRTLATTIGHPRDLARALVKLGDLDASPDRKNSIPLYEQAHAILLAEAAKPSPTLAVLDDLSWSYNRLSGMACICGRNDEALDLADQHVALAERLLTMSGDGLRHYNMAAAIAQRHRCLIAISSDCDDIDELERAHEHAEAAVTAEPERRAYLIAAQHANESLVDALVRRRDSRRALALLDRAMALADRLGHDDPDDEEAASIIWQVAHHAAALATAMWDAAAGPADHEAVRQLASRTTTLLANHPTVAVPPDLGAMLQHIGLGDEGSSPPTTRTATDASLR